MISLPFPRHLSRRPPRRHPRPRFDAIPFATPFELPRANPDPSPRVNDHSQARLFQSYLLWKIWTWLPMHHTCRDSPTTAVIITHANVVTRVHGPPHCKLFAASPVTAPFHPLTLQQSTRTTRTFHPWLPRPCQRESGVDEAVSAVLPRAVDAPLTRRRVTCLTLGLCVWRPLLITTPSRSIGHERFRPLDRDMCASHPVNGALRGRHLWLRVNFHFDQIHSEASRWGGASILYSDGGFCAISSLHFLSFVYLSSCSSWPTLIFLWLFPMHTHPLDLFFSRLAQEASLWGVRGPVVLSSFRYG